MLFNPPSFFILLAATMATTAAAATISSRQLMNGCTGTVSIPIEFLPASLACGITAAVASCVDDEVKCPGQCSCSILPCVPPVGPAGTLAATCLPKVALGI
ncbi:hypothetical protein GGX14DRAFT_468515 [Mycena pura]|uniref:Uncharacterized protein n=1 Tax=Mycena pura TaxID=153505 RepID=A0AAD6V0E2_9AGAR|nr:hypothetical protein GGX14DRAFT_468515 [Mycena pura]